MLRTGALILWVLALGAAPGGDAPGLPGFSLETSKTQRQWEAKFRDIPSPARLRELVRRLSARPHHLGSPYDRETARWLAAEMREWGLDARIETYDVLFPTPKERVLEMLAPRRFTARLEEPPVPDDPTSSQRDEQLPTYNAYSADGDVTARLVYVNYGVPEDYRELERLGVSVRGAIVIARYGGSWRGIKPKVAAEHGAVGCLIYSDPRDDGYFHGDAFPNGPYRPPDGVERGSVVDMPLYPGDPLTPGVGATRDAPRLPRSEARTLARIPVLPISYADAQPLLAALGGPVAPESWRGALPLTYRVGPGPATARLKLAFDWKLETVHNVIARIPGATWPDEWVLRGNHHDAWVNGARDPVSAAAALLEEARAMGELLRQGWRPARTIVYCLWGGEEPGLLGSTEWVEHHAAELRQHAVAYLNTDSNGRGPLSMGGSPILERFINDVARDIEDPDTKMPAWKRAQLARLASGTPGQRRDARERRDLRIYALGSGSDYTAFVHHLGIPALNLGYGGEDGGGIYHSIYDGFYWYTRFSDADFAYGRALAQTVGTAVLRLAGAELLPFEFTNAADTAAGWVGELRQLAEGTRDEIRERNRQIEEGVFRAAAGGATAPPRGEPEPPPLDFAPLARAVQVLEQSARRYEAAVSAAGADGGAALRRPGVAEINAILRETERALTLPEGLPGRPWFRHMLYAPGIYTGYGVKTMPAVREAIEQKRWTEAGREIARVAQVLERQAERIGQAASALAGL